MTLQLLKSLLAPHLLENLVECFALLAICLHAKNRCDSVTPSGYIQSKNPAI